MSLFTVWSFVWQQLMHDEICFYGKSKDAGLQAVGPSAQGQGLSAVLGLTSDSGRQLAGT